MAADSFCVHFHVVFKIFYLVSKILYISTSISKTFAAGLEPATIRLYLRDFRLSTPPNLWLDLTSGAL